MVEGKKTPLYDMHVKYGGKIVEFGGWLLPVQYSGIKEEHQAVRTKAGLFDVSHMGEFFVKGAQALDFVQKIITNDAAKLVDGQVLYTPMCYSDGGTVDDLLVYRFNQEKFLLVVNAANIEKDWQWVNEHKNVFQVELQNASDTIGQLAIQGPLASKILKTLTDAPLDKLVYYHFFPKASVAGKEVILSRTGYTGEDGFEIYCHAADTPMLWEKLMAAGADDGILPTGLGCRDTLRFEACFPLYGHELTATTSPLEAGIGFFVKLDKPAFIGHDALQQQKADGLRRKTVGIEMLGRGVARAGYPIYDGDRQIGSVTTGSYAPTLNKNLALGLIEADAATIGKEIAIEIRGKKIAAKIIKKPFYKREVK